MPLSVTCPGCHKRLKAPEKLAGRRLPCPNCRQPVLVPAAEDDAGAYLLQSDTPADTQPLSDPVPESPSEPVTETPPEPATRPGKAPRKKSEKNPATLPPLTTNDPPLWLRHLHWLLVLAMLPLAFSLLQAEAKGDLKQRVVEALEKLSPEEATRFSAKLDARDGEASLDAVLDALFAILPERKLAGAFLRGDSWAHWGFAAGATLLFMTFFLLLASGKTAEPGRLLGIGLFTATAGILFLLIVQKLAILSRGVWLHGGNIVVVVFYVIKFIGFSYQAALDPENGFVLSFVGYTLGVGFCEEVCKALPLLFYYRQPRDQGWRTAFLWGLASGAGFGIAEGIMYSGHYYNGIHGPGIYVVRFVSCIALHALWTGSVAITLNQKQGLIQAELSWYDYIPRLVVIVGVPMVLHGLYDTLLKKEMQAGALAVAVCSFLFLAFQISRLHGADDEEAKAAMLREYKRRRASLS